MTATAGRATKTRPPTAAGPPISGRDTRNSEEAMGAPRNRRDAISTAGMSATSEMPTVAEAFAKLRSQQEWDVISRKGSQQEQGHQQ
jgi:hypothetical protein